MGRAERLAGARREKERQAERQRPNFFPYINDYPGISGSMRVLEDPEGFMQRVARHKQDQEAKVRECQKRAQDKEDARLTFQPEVNKVPPFVKRIAASYRLLRDKENAARENVAD